MGNITLTKADIALELLIAIVGGIAVVLLLKYLPLITDHVRSWWAERSAVSRQRQEARIQKELDNYKALLEIAVRFQAEAFYQLSRILVVSILFMALLILNVNIDTASMREHIAPMYKFFHSSEEYTSGMKIINDMLIFVDQIFVIILLIIFRYVVYSASNFFKPKRNLKRLEAMLEKLKTKNN